MSSIDYDEPRRHRSHRYRDDPRDGREPRYVETQETYVRGPTAAAPEPPYLSRQTELVRRPVREDSDLSIEEVRREFPPPSAGAYAQRSMARDDRYGPPMRSRSAERGYGDPRRSYNDLDERKSRKSMLYPDQETKPRRRSLSRNEKILAGVGGAIIAAGAKELYDRKQADGRPVSRNALQTAAIGAAGAFAGYEGAEFYAKHQAKGKEVKKYVARKGRDGEVEEFSSSDEEHAKPKKSRRKSIVEGALGLAGLGAAAKAVDGKHHSRRGSGDSYSSGPSRKSTRSKSRAGGRGKSPEGAAKFQQAAKAALLAGATEAFRVRKEPGGWGGEKGKRIITAAIGAGGIDAAADHDPDKKSKRHLLEAVVGGLAGNRLINGSRSNVDDDGKSTRSGRSRSRSKGPGGSGGGAGLAALATAGLGALAGKKLLDRSKSRSRSRGTRSRSRGAGRSRRYSSDSFDSRSPSRDRGKDRHKRSKSVTDYARKGLASLGIGAAAGAASDRDRDRDRDVVEETEVVHKSRRRRDDDGYDRRSRHGGSSRDDDYVRDRGDPYADPRYADSRLSNISSRNGDGRRSKKERRGNRDRRIAEGKESASDSESSLGSSSGDEKRIKKMKGKQLLTAGLATVATIHAAHNVYQSMEKRDARHKAVEEGAMSPEEARKLKAKATLQDVASIGIAALGIKGAVSEIKGANQMRNDCRELREEKEKRHQKRIERLQRQGNSQPRRKPRYDSYDDGASGYNRYDNVDRDSNYVDSNPYSAALPAPPVGYDNSR
ncbi:hypothetical protein BJ875DRAFT_93530 [Amylocarpus encephaloides]|uniref:DUF3824 domain-containing protein n=1 Tax=Amylocarpus encephaloides TaxID=45428 RepID=A0A9P7YE44_9HELO|nr:hypothetical protein BJ875DRAFT_93530 [Amylocarpus encephaloides]